MSCVLFIERLAMIATRTAEVRLPYQRAPPVGDLELLLRAIFGCSSQFFDPGRSKGCSSTTLGTRTASLNSFCVCECVAGPAAMPGSSKNVV